MSGVERAQLIARKGALKARIERTRRELDGLRRRYGPQPDRHQQRSLNRLQSQLEQLMGQEYTLRQQIDAHG